jgi:PhzF family phenazine biosynthesis protein
MVLECFIIDSFSDKLFSGNPAVIVLTSEVLEEKLMVKVAAEFGFPETAFLHQNKDQFSIRWFTPKLEIDLCGHATLAAAHIIWEIGHVDKDKEIRFNSKSGILTAKNVNGWIELDFPSDVPKEVEPSSVIEKALGVTPIFTGKTKTDFFVVLESEDAIQKLNPDIPLIASLPSDGLIVTAPTKNKDYDFVSRVFAPNCGLDEDPVCGSAHCAMGPYWSQKIGRKELIAFQLSSRGGFVKVRVADDRTHLSGMATTFLRGSISI